MTIQAGYTVRIHYKGALQDGTVFDDSEGAEPLEFTAGGDELIPGMSHAVIGMAVGEKKTVEIAPEQGYGEHREEMIFHVPTEQLPEGAGEGAVLGVETPDGTLRVTLIGFEGEAAILDGNHFLAGKTLVFDIAVVSFDVT